MSLNEKLLPFPVETTLMLMGGKWKTIIVQDLLTRTKRFSELKNQ